ncbi:hypothetical protein CRYUN_Cryun37aG0063100 [Craigia yunnanensis]
MNGHCANPPWSASSSLIPRSTSPGGDQTGSSAQLNLSPYLASSFRYKKRLGNVEGETADITECVVCLLGFEDDEEVRKLHRCNHSFHAPCIDMWMYSHSNCPICRTHVDRRDTLVFTSDDNSSMEVLTDTSISP